LKETAEDLLTENKAQSEIEEATLVYESENNLTNEAGWVNFTLPETFKCSGNKNLKVIVRTVAASSSGFSSTDCYYTEAPGRHQQWTAVYNNTPTDMGTLNGNRPNIRIRKNVLCGANPPVADFLVKTPDETQTDFYINDTLSFTDRSTGPVVNWEWSFPEAAPESSTEENPAVSYTRPGTYTVTLIVSNHLGADTLQKTIRIQGKVPAIRFSSSASEGFTTYPEYGKLLPLSGGTVSFHDESIYNPISWQWELEGSDSGQYQERTVSLNYPSGENTYSVALTAGNEIGSASREIDGYVKVGGTAPIWNMPYGDAGDAYPQISENVYLTGTNTEYATIAEKFTDKTAGRISQVDCMITVVDEKNISPRIFPVVVYNEKEGKPGETLATFNLKGSNINRSGYTTVVFPNPVSVSGNFYIGIKGLTTVTSKIAVGSSQDAYSTAYAYKNGDWIALEEIDPQKRKISLNVVPIFTYLPVTPTALVTPDETTSQITVYPNPVNDYLNVSSRSPIEKIVVQDIQGHSFLVLNAENKLEITLPASNWTKGVYIMKIQTKTSVSNHKIMKK
jgi:PKD repeat protein